MGDELDKPNCERNPFNGSNELFRYGINEIQGWKKTMEVFNIKETNIGPDKNINIFGIFDGHSGPEISKYLSQHFINELQKNDNFINNNYRIALEETFKNLDLSFRTEEVNNKLIFDSKQSKWKKTQINDIYKTISNDNNNTLNEDDLNNINYLMEIIEPKNLEDVLISDYVGSSGIVLLILDKRTFIAKAGNSRCIAINKKLCMMDDKKLFNSRTYNKKEKLRVKQSKGIKYGKEKENIFENEEFLYTKGFGDFQYKNNKLIDNEEQEISSKPDICEIENENIKYLIICNYGFLESGKLINDKNNNDYKNIEKNIANYFINKLKNEQKNISDIISDYYDEYISKQNINKRNTNINKLSCIIIDFYNNL